MAGIEQFDPDTCERIFHAALREGDAEGVDAALRVLAVQDPQRALRLYDAVRVALDIARERTGEG